LEITRATGARAIVPDVVRRQSRIDLARVDPARHQPILDGQALITASSAPAAPRVWPVAPLVELQGVFGPNTLVTA